MYDITWNGALFPTKAKVLLTALLPNQLCHLTKDLAKSRPVFLKGTGLKSRNFPIVDQSKLAKPFPDWALGKETED